MIKRVLTVIPLLVPLIGCGAEAGADLEPSDNPSGEAPKAVGTTHQPLTELKPWLGNRPVLVVLYEADQSLPLNHGRNPEWWRTRVFGNASTPRNIASYIQANAKGRFSIIEATNSTWPNPPQNGVRIVTDTQWRGNEVTIDFPSIPARSNVTRAVVLNGTQQLDNILPRAHQANIEDGLRISAFGAPQANVASVTIQNDTDAAIDPAPLRFGAYGRDLDQRAGITRAMLLSTDPERFTKAERQRMLRMVAESGFDFRPFDRSPQDGIVKPEELTILQMTTSDDGWGLLRYPIAPDGCVDLGAGQPRWCGEVPVVGSRSILMNIAHELSHNLVGTVDLYGQSCNSGDLSVMGNCTARSNGDWELEANWTVLLDPWHRQALGWLRAPTTNTPQTCPAGVTCTTRLALASSPLAPPAGSSDAHRFNSGKNSLFLEYRSKTLGYIYDDLVPQDGVAFWVGQFGADGKPEVVDMVPQPDPLPPPDKRLKDHGFFNVAPVACIGDAKNPSSRGRPGSMQFGQSYRVRWVDGTDSGYLFTIGQPAADNTVVVSYTMTAQAPRCSQNSSEYAISSLNEPSFPFLTYKGGVLNFTDTTNNNGAVASASASTTSYYLSTDRVFSANDVRIASRTVPALPAGGSSTGNATGTIPNTVTPGDNYVIACADTSNAIAEGVENNNCVASVASWLVLF